MQQHAIIITLYWILQNNRFQCKYYYILRAFSTGSFILQRVSLQPLGDPTCGINSLFFPKPSASFNPPPLPFLIIPRLPLPSTSFPLLSLSFPPFVPQVSFTVPSLVPKASSTYSTGLPSPSASSFLSFSSIFSFPRALWGCTTSPLLRLFIFFLVFLHHALFYSLDLSPLSPPSFLRPSLYPPTAPPGSSPPFSPPAIRSLCCLPLLHS